MPGKPASAEDLAAALEVEASDLAVDLDEMTTRGYVTEVTIGGTGHYELTPLMFGFFEYTFMRADHEALAIGEVAELFERYFRQPGVIAELVNADGDTKMMRVFGHETAMPLDVRSEILPYERASEVIARSGGGAVGPCSCRHQRLHAGAKECDHPVDDTCMSFGAYAEWMVERGFARPAPVDELLAILARARDGGLIHAGDNVRDEIAFLCNCCSCCCVSLRALKSDGVLGLQPSGFLAGVDADACTGCEVCVEACPVEAIAMERREGAGPDDMAAVVDRDRCLGCGVCVGQCPVEAISFLRRPDVAEPPLDVAEKMRRIAREKGRPLAGAGG